MTELPSSSRADARSSPKAAYSLVELLVIIAVTGVLVGIMILSLTGVLRRSDSVIASSNLRQIITAMNIYATEHGGEYPSTSNKSGSDKELWRLRILYDEGYIESPDVFVNPTNVAANAYIGGPVFDGKRSTFTARYAIYTQWRMGPAVETAIDINSNQDIPIVWDMRADRLYAGNRVLTPDGRPGGHFAYPDGEVRLIGPPTNVIRGQPDIGE